MKIKFLVFILIYFTNNIGEGTPNKRGKSNSGSSTRGRNENEGSNKHLFYTQHGESASMSDSIDGTNHLNITTDQSSEPNIGHESSTQTAGVENQNYFGNNPFQLDSWFTNPTQVPLDNFDLFGDNINEILLPNHQFQQPVRQESIMETKPETENSVLEQTEQKKENRKKRLEKQLNEFNQRNNFTIEENTNKLICNVCSSKVIIFL
uniref:Uncharacterized protein n=1 Tax=Meloidogyne enterolobii TaxID=390850 RepID=A0A6V7WEZ1_MELEN|nr:unnamed protein product [Meloidogyne enterolobii]